MATNRVPPRKTYLLQETNISNTTRHLMLVVIEHIPCMIKLKNLLATVEVSLGSNHRALDRRALLIRAARL